MSMTHNKISTGAGALAVAIRNTLRPLCAGAMLIGGALLFTGCGSDGSWESDDQGHSAQVSGAAVKGPRKGGSVEMFLLDYSRVDLKGERVATGETNDAGQLTGLAFDSELIASGPFLIEVRGGTELNGEQPLIPTLRTIVTAAQAEAKVAIYATPLTTMAVEMARLATDVNDPAGARASFSEALRNAEVTVKNVFGLNIAGNLLLFRTAPFYQESFTDTDLADPDNYGQPTDNGLAAREALNYRTVIEASSALIGELLVMAPNTSADQMLLGIARDLSDGVMDGLNAGSAIPELAEVTATDEISILGQPANRVLSKLIPGYTETIAELNVFMLDEAEEIAPDFSSGVEQAVPSIAAVATGYTVPVANAGADRSVRTGDPATVSGAGTDEGGDPLSFSWQLLSAPAGSSVSLVNANSATVGLTPDVDGAYVLQLQVSDATAYGRDQVVITAVTSNNTPPVADAGPDQVVAANAPVILDGSASADPDVDNEGLTYQWELIAWPEGFSRDVHIDNPGGAITNVPMNQLNWEGGYVFQLTVTDDPAEPLDAAFSDSDTVMITVDKDLGSSGQMFGGALLVAALGVLLGRRRRAKH